MTSQHSPSRVWVLTIFRVSHLSRILWLDLWESLQPNPVFSENAHPHSLAIAGWPKGNKSVSPGI